MKIRFLLIRDLGHPFRDIEYHIVGANYLFCWTWLCKVWILMNKFTSKSWQGSDFDTLGFRFWNHHFQQRFHHSNTLGVEYILWLLKHRLDTRESHATSLHLLQSCGYISCNVTNWWILFAKHKHTLESSKAETDFGNSYYSTEFFVVQQWYITIVPPNRCP